MSENQKKRGYGLVDANIVQDPSLSIEARAIYAILASYSDAKTRLCTPSVQTLIKVSGISKDRFYKHMGQLVEKGIVSKHSQMDGNLKRRNTYFLVDNINGT